jgi:hypothetical protein
MYTDKDITIVFTNEGSTQVALPSISIDKALKNEIHPYEDDEESQEEIDTFNHIPDIIRDFEPAEFIEQSDISLNQLPLYAKTQSVGNKYNWNVALGTPIRSATLQKQTKVNGRTVNIWVEDNEYSSSKISSAKVNEISSSVGIIYASVVSIAGEPWGTHRYTNVIDSDQPLDIVLVNFDNNKQPWGTVGYFWSRNNFKKSTYSDSNEALAIFVDTETYYLGSNGKSSTLSTIAHELTHAINFYQRNILTGNSNAYATFLEEMTAVMMEDVISSKISYNDVSGRYTYWLKTPLYQQDFANWDGEVSSYAVAGSFGAFLLRQYGIDFYKTLLRESGSSLNTLDAAIKKYNNDGLTKALRNWGASIAMFPAATAPKGFGYPARDNDNGFNFEAFDGSTYKQYRKLLTYSPSSLAPHAHFPFLRKPTASYTYNEQLKVPSGVSVSIVVK